MMSRSARLGFFILFALSIFAVGIFLIGNSQLLFRRTYQLRARFGTVAGLVNGSEVHMGGMRVGVVSSMELSQRSGENVLVVMDMDKSTLGLIKKDSVASIRTEGVLGAKHVNISFGSPNGPHIQNGDTIASVHELDSSEAMAKTNEILLTADNAVKNIETTTVHMKDIARKIDSGVGTLGQLVNNEGVYKTLNSAAVNVQSASENIKTTVQEASAGAAAFMDNMEALKQTSAKVDEIAGKIDSGEGTIAQLINSDSIYNELHSAAANVNSAVGNISETVQEAQTGIAAFKDDMEALKHNWLVRGFFKKRGYNNEAELTKYQIAEIPDLPAEKYFMINATDIFGSEGVKLKHKDRLNSIGQFLQGNPFYLAVIAVYSDMKGDSEEDRTLTQARALAIRKYLVDNFKLDDTRIKTDGLGKQSASNTEPPQGIKVLVYSTAKETQ